MKHTFQALWPLQTVLNNQYPDLRTRRKEDYITQARRKKHTVKNLYTTNRKGLITYKTKHKQIGKRHDYGIHKDNHPKLPDEVTTMYDLGFLGVEGDYPEQKSSVPIKKEKDCELKVQQNEYNNNNSEKRIAIVHRYCEIKEVQNNK